jgi:hypothetical protein
MRVVLSSPRLLVNCPFVPHCSPLVPASLPLGFPRNPNVLLIRTHPNPFPSVANTYPLLFGWERPSGRSSPLPRWITDTQASASTMYAAFMDPPTPRLRPDGFLPFCMGEGLEETVGPLLIPLPGRDLLYPNPHNLPSSWTSGPLWDGGQWGLWRVGR